MKNQQYKLAFLILNYETYWEVIACVNSIFDVIGRNNITSETDKIVIVDNGSKNESFQKLQDMYRNEKGIYILSSNENLGFARGNNVGFKFIKDTLTVDFIVMINSDIIMTDFKFKDKLVAYYNEYHFAVAGPNVIGPSGEGLNPCVSSIFSVEDCNERIKKMKSKIRLCQLRIEPLFAILERVKKVFKLETKKQVNIIIDKEKGGQLHGCFMIFSKEYIRLFDGLYDKTFLYGEETILRLRCVRSNLKMCFLEEIGALHNESRTEKYIGGDICSRHLRRYKNLLFSLGIIKEYIENPLLR